MHLKGAFADAKNYGITDLSAIVQSYNFDVRTFDG